MTGTCAPHRGVNDPRVTRERLNVTPLGHRTYLDAKAKGENRMSEKAGCNEAIKMQARRDPDGMVKAGLPEPQCPLCKRHGLDTMAHSQGPQDNQCPDSTE
jgi:hypothetical protein